MKHLFLTLAVVLLAGCMPAAAQTGTITIMGLPSFTGVNTGTINTSDQMYLYQASQGTPDTSVTMAQLRAFMQTGTFSGTVVGSLTGTATNALSVPYTGVTSAPWITSNNPIVLTGAVTGTSTGTGTSTIVVTITTGSVTIADLATTGTALSTTFLSGTGSWTTIAAYTLPAATTSALGGVIPDGATLTVDGFGNLAVGTVPSTSISGLPTFPSGAIVGTSDFQTLTNKSIASSEITGLPTFPSGTIVGTSDSQTLTNKSISGAEINTGTLTVGVGGTGTTTFTAYGVICAGTSSTSAFQTAGTGTSGQVLTSAGSSALPAWQALPGAVVYDTTATFTASGYTTIAVGNSGSGSGTITLPSSPPVGEWIRIVDMHGTGDSEGLANYPITVSFNNNIVQPNGSSANTFVMNRNYQDVWLFGENAIWYMTERHPPTYVAATLSSGSVTVTNPFISTATPPRAEYSDSSAGAAGALYISAISSGTATFRNQAGTGSDSITVAIP